MKTVMEQLHERKSVRIFEKRDVSDEMRHQLFQAAYQAPTAGNMMLYTLLEITDQQLKEALAESCDHQPFIADAPLVLVFLADYQRWLDTFAFENLNPRPPGPGDLMLACADALIAAQNMVVAAQSLGLGSCYIGDITENCETVRSLLHLPEYVFPAAMLVVGHPTRQQLQRTKPKRFDDRFIRFQNQYRRLSPEEHQEMHLFQKETHQESAGNIQESLETFFKRKYDSDFAREMNRSVEVYWQAYIKNNKKL
ncbi:nitroreductase family protein [Anoxynatronum buryatiense]|uniref:Nitroreductase domain-containing protein n=1 Tax=Anoxynatronum buryatiense TaxID=489973 RepID=A0AA45WXH0_9CLOT|nr:nitroreductase family protein [Anoxynatronum buryatiense]SMP63972.1 hypothetical protein/nitroreductase/FMN reductase (NADPH)/FMN reductase [NAD(P)H] [Anoxynatronum buryatiense]